MKLLIISHTPHYRRSGALVGWGPTVREIDYLSELFEQVVHVAPLHEETSPASAIAYESPRVCLRPVPPSGGDGLRGKLSILAAAPRYLHTIVRELPGVDAVHVRCPANISLMAILLLTLVRFPRVRWVKYAGNWRPGRREAVSYMLQRWWLNKNLHRGVTTINGRWTGCPKHVRPFFNPCLTQAEITRAHFVAGWKELTVPTRLLYVGRLERAKGVDRALKILARLKQRGLSATLDLVGDGPERAEFEQLAAQLQVRHLARFHGWLPRAEIAPLYARSHIMVFPSNSEGWPKVLSEAMAYGVVPVAASVSSIPQYLREFSTGRAYPSDDVEAFTEAVAWYGAHPEHWKQESRNGVRAAPLFSYDNYLLAVRDMLNLERHGSSSARRQSDRRLAAIKTQ